MPQIICGYYVMSSADYDLEWYCYNVESILIVSWAAGLAYSVYRPNASGSNIYYTSSAAKPIAVVLPIIQVGLMRSSIVRSSSAGFYFLANVISRSRFLFLPPCWLLNISVQWRLAWHLAYFFYSRFS